MSETIHASTVAIGGRGVMILGASGAGKSDLALRLIDRGAMLVADDYTIVTREGAASIAQPPATIAGKIEVRGIGIVERPFLARAPVSLAVTIGTEAERMPEPHTLTIAGVDVAAVTIDPHAPSAPIKVELALQRVPA